MSILIIQHFSICMLILLLCNADSMSNISIIQVTLNKISMNKNINRFFFCLIFLIIYQILQPSVFAPSHSLMHVML